MEHRETEKQPANFSVSAVFESRALNQRTDSLICCYYYHYQLYRAEIIDKCAFTYDQFIKPDL